MEAAVNITVFAGMFSPIAKVSVANRHCTNRPGAPIRAEEGPADDGAPPPVSCDCLPIVGLTVIFTYSSLKRMSKMRGEREVR